MATFFAVKDGKRYEVPEEFDDQGNEIARKSLRDSGIETGSLMVSAEGNQVYVPDTHLKQATEYGLMFPDVFENQKKVIADQNKRMADQSGIGHTILSGAGGKLNDELGAAMDEPIGAIKEAGKFLGFDSSKSPEAERYRVVRDYLRRLKETQAKANPVISFISDAVGEMALLPAQSVPGNIIGAAIGAIGSSEADTAGDLAIDAGIGAGAGAVIPAAGAAFRAGKSLVPGMDQAGMSALGKKVAQGVNRLTGKISEILPFNAKATGSQVEELLNMPAGQVVSLRGGPTAATITDAAEELQGALTATQKARGAIYEPELNKWVQSPSSSAREVLMPGPLADSLDQINEAVTGNPNFFKTPAFKDTYSAFHDAINGRFPGAPADKEQALKLGLRRAKQLITDLELLPAYQGLKGEEVKTLQQLKAWTGEAIGSMADSQALKQADTLYTKTSDLIDPIYRKAGINVDGTPQIDPSKLDTHLRSGRAKGEAFNRDLEALQKHLNDTPGLNNIPEVRDAYTSIEKIKKVLSDQQLVNDVKVSGSSDRLIAMSGLAFGAGPAAILAMPVVSPYQWKLVADQLHKLGQSSLVKSVEAGTRRLTPVISRTLGNSNVQTAPETAEEKRRAAIQTYLESTGGRKEPQN